MEKNLGLSIVIGAALGAGFKSAITGSIRQITTLGQTVDQLESAQGRIDRFERIREEVSATATAFNRAEDKVRTLTAETRRAGKPTKEFAKKLGEAKRQANELKTKLHEKRRALQGVRAAMAKAGQSTRNLTQQQQALARSSDFLRTKQVQLKKAMDQRSAAQHKRHDLKFQAMDMMALGYAMMRPVKAAADFESGMANVRKAVDFKSETAFTQIGRDIRRLAVTDIPFAQAQLTDITTSAGKAGLPQDELTAFTRDAAKVGIAWDLDTNQAGSGMIGLRTIFKLGQKEVMGLADSYNYLENNMDATAGGILRIVNRAGSTGELLGLTGQQIGALAATFLSLKTTTQVAATGMNALFTRLATADRQPLEFKAALEEVGWTAEDLKYRLQEDAQAGIIEFLDSVKDAEDVQGVLGDLFGLEYSDDMAKLVGGTDQYKKALNLVADDTKFLGSIQKEFEIRAKTANNQWQIFKNKITDLGIVIGNVVLPPANEFMSVVGNTALVLGDLAERGGIVTKVVVGLTMGLVGLNIATIAAKYAWTFIAGGWATMKAVWIGAETVIWLATAKLTGFNAVSLITAARMRLMGIGALYSGFMTLAGTALPAATAGIRAMGLAMMANPIGLVVGALVGAGVLIYTYWDQISSFMAGIWDAVKPKWEAFVGWAGKALKTLVAPVSWIGDFFADDGEKKVTVGATVKNMAKSATVASVAAVPVAAVPVAAVPNTKAASIETASLTQKLNREIVPVGDTGAEKKITVHQAPTKIVIQPGADQSASEIADEVVRRINNRDTEALYDTE